MDEGILLSVEGGGGETVKHFYLLLAPSARFHIIRSSRGELRMNKKEFGILGIQLLALFSFLYSLQFIGDLAGEFYGMYFYYAIGLQEVLERIMPPFINLSLYLNASFLLWYFSPHLANRMFMNSSSDSVSDITRQDWLTLGFILLGTQLIGTSIHDSTVLIPHVGSIAWGVLDRYKSMAVLGILFQICLGLVLILRARRLANCLIR